MLTYRELDPSEFPSIPPEALDGHELPTMGGVRVFAALDGDKIKACWVVIGVIHAEPIWLAPDVRKSPTVIRRLAAGVKGILEDWGYTTAVAIIPDSVPATRRIAQWLRAKEIPGRIFLMSTKEK
jgi:NADH:ubiquinone oxidoreductase subunit D